MKNTIGLGVIVKPTHDEAVHLERLLACVAKYVDDIQLTVTGELDEIDKLAEKYHATISRYKWHDDFSAARNYNLGKIETDWYLWLDADDTLDHPENLDELVLQAEDRAITGLGMLYEYNHDERGNVIDAHWKTNLIKNDGTFAWKGAIHEDPIPQTVVKWQKQQAIKRIHHADNVRAAESSERNLRILEAELKRDPKEPRTKFYLGRGYILAGRYAEATTILQEYLELSGWDQERYEARLLIGGAFLELGNTDDALRAYNDAILEREQDPDAYIYKAKCYLKRGDYAKALTNYQIALSRPTPSADVYFNPMLYSVDVLGGMAVCYLNLAKVKEAHDYILKALNYDSKNPNLLQLYGLIKSLRQKQNGVQLYVDLARYLKDNGGEKNIAFLLQSVPPALMDNEILLSLAFTYLNPKKWPKKSIALYCGQTVEDWYDGAENAKGIGGSETAVIELSKRLVKKGWQVTVYNSCNAPPEGIAVNGVTYKNYWTFNRLDEFDVLWVWRVPELMDYDVKARLTVLDLHDTMTPYDLTEKRVAKIDKIFVKSNYHRSLYPKVADDKFMVVGNGIDLSRFEGDKTKEPYRFVYSSTPNRGLDILLEYIWPKIKANLPDAELHVYYGWTTFYQLEKNNPERMKWMNRVQELMKQPGVVDHGRVGQKELAQDLMKTNFWLYPTYFPEIHCITACEMQAAGVIPITSGYAALAETQKGGIALDGDVYDPDWQDKFAQETIALAQSPIGQKTVRELTLKEAKSFSWDLVADTWDKELCA